MGNVLKSRAKECWKNTVLWSVPLCCSTAISSLGSGVSNPAEVALFTAHYHLYPYCPLINVWTCAHEVTLSSHHNLLLVKNTDSFDKVGLNKKRINWFGVLAAVTDIIHWSQHTQEVFWADCLPLNFELFAKAT